MTVAVSRVELRPMFTRVEFVQWNLGVRVAGLWLLRVRGRVRVRVRVGCTQVQQVIVEFLQNIIGFSYLVPISLYVTIGNSGPGPTPPDPNPVPNPCPPSSSVPSYNRAFRVAMLCGSHLRYNYSTVYSPVVFHCSPHRFFIFLLFCIAVCVCQCLFASLFDSHC